MIDGEEDEEARIDDLILEDMGFLDLHSPVVAEEMDKRAFDDCINVVPFFGMVEVETIAEEIQCRNRCQTAEGVVEFVLGKREKSGGDLLDGTQFVHGFIVDFGQAAPEQIAGPCLAEGLLVHIFEIVSGDPGEEPFADCCNLLG